MNTKLLLAALVLLPTTLGPALAESPVERTRASVPQSRDRAGLRGFLRSIDATPEQRAVAREQARAAGPVARSARSEGRRIRVEALRGQGSDRAAARARILELRERTLESLRPMAQKLISTLTSEQKRKLEHAARARGRELDDARLEKLVSWLLTRHGAPSRSGKGARR